MTSNMRRKQIVLSSFAGLTVGLLSLILTVQLASASARLQSEEEPPVIEYYSADECQDD